MRNYQKELEQVLLKEENKGKTLLLHSCCAPCSSYVLVYLKEYFRITVFYYNPNITPDSEYRKRVEEQKRLIEELNRKGEGYPISYLDGDYEPEAFFTAVKGYEHCPERGERCEICFRLRLEKSGKVAKEGKFDFFATTLTLSPLKNAELLNKIGEETGEKLGVSYLVSDFKKKDGYKTSIRLSQEYDLYRQDYCGCIYSKLERERNKEK